MYLVLIAWLFVVLLMTLAEAMSPQGTLLGAFFTLLLYGLLPCGLLAYILGTPGRKRRRRLAQQDEGGQAPAAGPVAPEREQG